MKKKHFADAISLFDSVVSEDFKGSRSSFEARRVSAPAITKPPRLFDSRTSVINAGTVTDLHKHQVLKLALLAVIWNFGVLWKIVSQSSHIKMKMWGLFLGLIAVVLENISAAATICLLYVDSQIFDSIPNKTYYKKAFSNALFNRLMVAISY